SRLHPLVKLPVEIVGGRSFLAPELEDADALESHLFHEFAQLFELRVGLAGKTDDEAGAEDEIGYPLAKLLDELAQEGGVATALHAAQHRIADVLERHVEIAGQVGLRRERVDELVGKISRIGVVEAQPADGKF